MVRYKFQSSFTDYYFHSRFNDLKKIVDRKTAVIITDENVFTSHEKLFKGWNCIVLKPGERYKVQQTVDSVIEQLITMRADRNTMLVGVGGGVVADLTGYVAATFLRGVEFGFVPTSILAMVDASIGGKNGINVGLFKNIVGTIRQPSFILFDVKLTSSLPEKEWRNGFAEIIKHACIKDAKMFRELEANGPDKYKPGSRQLALLVERNAILKTRIVQRDELETGERRILNFGHTLGHALENLYELPHGHAVSLGMVAASIISFSQTGFNDPHRVINLLEAYGLPVSFKFDKKNVVEIISMDKKRMKNEVNYVLLERIGKATVRKLPLKKLADMFPSL